MFSANPVLSAMRVLKTIPSDSPQLTMQNETSVIRKYIDTVRCRFTAIRRRENNNPEAISNGISRIRYTKKNELTEYALSVYSCRGFSERTRGTIDVAPPYPVKGIPLQWVLANVLQQSHKIYLFSGKSPHHRYHVREKERKRNAQEMIC